MVRMVVVRLGLVLSVGVVTLAAGPVLASPDTLQPPPGPITGTFKTLNEVRPGRAIRQVDIPFTITQPGEYYLAENITASPSAGNAAIAINLQVPSGGAAGSVRLDLNGHSIRYAGAGTPLPSMYGVFVAAVEGPRVEVTNGHISGFGRGIQALAGVHIENINFSNHATVNIGEGAGVWIQRGTQTTIRNCSFVSNSVGVRFDNQTNLNPFGGSLVENCLFSLNGSGVQCDSSVVIRSSRFEWSLFSGVVLADDNVVESCVLQRGGSGGASALRVSGGRNTVRDCVVENNAFVGIEISGSSNVIERNTVVGNGAGQPSAVGGLFVGNAASNNVIRANTVRGNAGNDGVVRNYAFNPTGADQYELLLSELPESINVPAIVRLSGVLQAPAGSTAAGITVSANDVTIDMSGGGISGAPTSGNGISVINNARNLRVLNGTVSGFAAGIAINDGAGATGSDCIIENMHIRNNRREAVLGGNVLRMTNCTITQNGPAAVPTIRAGDACTIENVNLAGNANTGPAIQINQGGTVRGCVVQSNSGGGIEVGNSSTVANNTVSNNGGAGIVAGFGTSVTDNTIRQNQLEGIRMNGSSGLARGNKLDFNARAAGNQAGILVTGNANVIEQNFVSASDFGISVSGTQNFVAQNRASTNAGGNYVVGAGNSFGPIVVVTGVGNFSATANSTHPQANFEH